MFAIAVSGSAPSSTKSVAASKPVRPSSARQWISEGSGIAGLVTNPHVVMRHRGGASMPASPMESRMARLEGAYEQVSQRLMNIDPRFDGVDRKIDLRFDALDKKIDGVRDALDKKIDGVREALDKNIDGVREALDKKIDGVREALEQRIDTLDAKIDQRFMWTIGVVVTTWLTTIASIYLHH
jgi:hypothetical protein